MDTALYTLALQDKLQPRVHRIPPSHHQQALHAPLSAPTPPCPTHPDHARAAWVDGRPEGALAVVHVVSNRDARRVLPPLVCIGQALNAVQEGLLVKAATTVTAPDTSNRTAQPQPAESQLTDQEKTGAALAV